MADRIAGWCDLMFLPKESADSIQSFLQDCDRELREKSEELVILSMRRGTDKILRMSLCSRDAFDANTLWDDGDFMW